MTLVAEFTIQMGGATLLTPNTRRRLHWAEQARITKGQRELACLVARQRRPILMPGLNTFTGPPFVVATGHRDIHLSLVRGSGQRLLDLDAIPAACKAYLDGIVDAGLLAGDQPKFCTPHYSQERGKRAELRVRVEQ